MRGSLGEPPDAFRRGPRERVLASDSPAAWERRPVLSRARCPRFRHAAGRCRLRPFASSCRTPKRPRSAGFSVYHLNIGQPDIPTPQGMLDAFRNHRVEVLEYGHSGGLWQYREGLAGYYRALGLEVSKEQILVTTAGSEAIIFAFLALLDPGDEILIPEPFYTNYNGFAVETGVRIVPVTCSGEDGYALPSDEVIRSKLTGPHPGNSPLQPEQSDRARLRARGDRATGRSRARARSLPPLRRGLSRDRLRRSPAPLDPRVR